MNIRHDERIGRFVADIGGEEAVLDYTPVGANTLDFRHTFVPPAHRGHGIAGQLVRHGLDHAREHGLSVIPSCPFVAEWIRAHPDYRALVTGKA